MATRFHAPMRALAFSRPAGASTTALLSTPSRQMLRSFQTGQIMRQEGVIAQRKPVGAFRGTLFGFLLGSVMAGAGLYYYVVEEYKVSNELLTEDIYALQAAVQRLEGYVQSVDEGNKSGK